MIRTAPSSTLRMVRLCLALLLPALLAACATRPSGNSPTMPVLEEQADYQAHARSHYTPPGPPEDPWGPYINEASNRFDVPAEWIRAVMHQESGGHLYDRYGNFITSTPGAMGLMQIMPPAYDDLRTQYNLGPDPYDPHDNILAGTAYIRQMYEIYGSPGFLAAYNYGPGSLDHYLRQNRALPRETRNYVAAIAPKIMGIWPHQRSRNDLIVARHDRTAQGPARMDTATPLDGGGSYDETTTAGQAVQTAETQDIRAAWAARGFSSPQPQPAAPITRPHSPPPRSFPPEPQRNTLRIQSIPLADAPARRRGATDMLAESTHDWAIQLGSYAGEKQALMVATQLRPRITPIAGGASVHVMPVRTARGTLYRARLINLTHSQATGACRHLRGTIDCLTIPPNAP
ncbi:transglycosylase SLT domain-containing protein [Bombella apis]|uniref:transglycosylase SLT domain-containing protein n=1 Tax=Bombella apis TaxID=1785988 RepID=UPI0012B7D213|nr:transglycosylase SLT domain-containing protein [Bombella apis]MPV99384.1 transglycosylase SLT domain-containing protein [Bombella apis]